MSKNNPTTIILIRPSKEKSINSKAQMYKAILVKNDKAI